ncbi:hypothetical protein LIER_42729 [Lithospermum erythrorhizon]|uniref:Uncharacterized protein n=1 Tax=Lithospermum erythrorhizon TaxID=34254 RepID=A0AAV3NUP1_LITER
MLDLYLLYKEVTHRGGFNQVTIERKWDEIASSLDLKRSDSMLLYQLQKLYQNILYPYEQIQHYRTPPKAKISDPSQVKQKRSENVLPHLVVSTDELGMPAENKKRKVDSQQQETTVGAGTQEKKKIKKKQPNGRESKKGHDVLVRPRTSYQFFVKAECDRLKKILGERTSYINLRTMASDKWKHFSETDKQPYVEASKADKERYYQELVTFKLQQEKQEDATTATTYSPNCNMLKFCTSPETERDYHVKFDPESGDLVLPPPNEPLIIESAAEIMKRGNLDATDPLFNLDEYECDNLTEPFI